MLVDRVCVACSAIFRTEARYLKRRRGNYCSRDCAAAAARRRKWENYYQQIANRFWERVDASAGESACWPYTGATRANGYGRLILRGKHELAHRMAYRFARGKIPDGLFVCHRCDNPPCCNPDHLFLGTHQDNVDDKTRKGRGRGRCSALRARV
jgi:hypothetical protein